MTIPHKKYRKAKVKISGMMAAPIIHLSQIRMSSSESKAIAEQDLSASELVAGVGAIVPFPFVFEAPPFVGLVFGEPPPRIV